MIATMLMAVLLLATWSLLGLYQNQFERNQQRTERSQLIRSVRQRLEEDLRRCLVDSLHENPSSSASPSSSSETDDDAAPATNRNSGPSSTTTSLFSEQADPLDALDTLDPLATEGMSSLGPDLAAELAQEVWLQPAIGLRGNARGLVLDALQPIEPTMATTSDSSDVRGLRDEQQAPPPDVVRRVIYLFTDEATSLRQGRPAGLVRCEWTETELLTLQSVATGGDLYVLLESLVPQWPVVEATGTNASMMFSESPRDPLDLNRQASTDLEQVTAHIEQRVDLLPEITAFRLRYFDGGGWRDRWDSRQEKMLPVAIELRFDVQRLEPVEEQNLEIDPVTGEPREQEESPLLAEEPTDDLAEPMDPRQMSVQTQMLLQQERDQRVIIFLQAPVDRSTPSDEFDREASEILPFEEEEEQEGPP
jgi:hypothetical protein